jgi:O-acetyl-ADP-ribose deacetylase (regulator of RNase III)
MIEYRDSGSMFDVGAVALVNPVNCRGSMGAGVAKLIKERYPACFQPYVSACNRGLLKPGVVLGVRAFEDTSEDGPEVASEDISTELPIWILHFPTKTDWRNSSKIGYIKSGLPELAKKIVSLRDMLTNVSEPIFALPALGCGYGNLKWADVQPLIDQHLSQIEGVRIISFLPQETV